MKRSHYYLFLLLSFCNTSIFSYDLQVHALTIYDKNDVFKYWLVKKLGKKHNDSGVFTKFINPLLISFQLSIPTPLSEIYSMPNIKIIGWRYKSCFAYQEKSGTKKLNWPFLNNNIIRPRFVSLPPERTDCRKPCFLLEYENQRS